MTNEKQQNRKTFIDCYRIGRSLEYMDRYDQEQAWKKLNSAIQRKRLHRRISYMSSVAAMVAIAFTSFYLWRGEDQAPAEKLADAQETVGQSGRPGVILSLSDGRRIDLSAREGKIGAGEEVVNHPENKQLFYAADQGGEKISRMNRLDEIVFYKPLTKENVTHIIDLMAADINRRLEDKQLTVDLTPAAKD